MILHQNHQEQLSGNEMTGVLLTGSNSGLGYELYKIIKNDDFFNEKIFISRSKNKKFTNKDKLIYLDFNNINLINKKINFSFKNKNIVFINSAATIFPIVPTKDIKIKELNKSSNVNFLAPFIISQYLAKKICKTKHKLLIINITSKAAEYKVKSWLAYSITKKSLKTSLDFLALENKNITIIHYNPGVMDTKMQKNIRNRTKLSMPDVNIYKNLKKYNKLIHPKEVAKKIYKKIINELK